MATGYEDLIPVASTTGYEDLIPKDPSFMTRLGRGAASLADVTLGGLIPGAVQFGAYPLARLGRSPEEAQAATQRLVSAVDQPFGKAFGVTQTPEYQQESGRQLLDFIGQNFQKGAKFISEKTGLHQADIENILGIATIAAPKVVQAAQPYVAPVMEQAAIGAKMPFADRLQARREAASLRDYARGPQIDAAADAQRLGIALNPTDIQSTLGPKLTTMMAGEKGLEAITAANKNVVRKVALDEMGLPPTTQLNGEVAFKQARTQVDQPYREVRKLPIQQADDAMIQRLEAIRSDLDVIGAREYAPAISKIVDDAISKTQTGLTGDKLLKNISVLRERAKKTYNNKSATTEALDIADTNLRIATELESMIDGSIANPKLLGEYRDARQKMARIYTYEAATDFNTGMVDVSKLARLTSSNNALTGNIASLGKIAGNFPDVFTTKAATPLNRAVAIGRTGAAGTLGGLAGYAIGEGYTGAAIGTVLGAGAGRIGQSFAANRMASPQYQAGLQLRDARIPVNQLAASMQPIPQNRAVVPYEAPVEVLQPGQGTYFPDFVIQPNQYGGRVVPGTPEAPRNILGYDPNVPVQGQPGAFDIMRQRERDLSMRQGAAAEAQQATAAATGRQPTGQGTPLMFNSAGNLVEVPIGGSAVSLAPTSLESAVQKLSGQVIEQPSTSYTTRTISPKSGAKPYTRIIKTEGEPTFERGVSRAFDLTAEERIAWKKTKVDFVEAAPELKGLSDKAIANKMMDRKWVDGTIVKLREQAAAFDDISKRASNAQVARDAAIKREQMLDVLADLEDSLRPARPVSSGIQGSKTREFNRNQMITNTKNQNAMTQ
jgi:hypothetical protein